MAPEETEDILVRIEQFAGLQFTKEEISVLTGIEKFSTEQKAAIAHGRLTAEIGIRRTLLAQAGSGDHKSLGEFKKLVEDRKAVDRKRKTW